eukprot:399224-Pelagomonas_calceolata.AAC.1
MQDMSAKAATLYTVLLLVVVGGTCNTEHALNKLKQLGLDHQRAIKLARKLHAHLFMYVNKFVTARRAIDISLLKTQILLTARFWSQVLPVTLQIPIRTFCACCFVVEGTHGYFEPMCILFLN